MTKRIMELEAELERTKNYEGGKGGEEEQPSMCSKGTPSIKGNSDDEVEYVPFDPAPEKVADDMAEVKKEENVEDTRSNDMKVSFTKLY